MTTLYVDGGCSRNDQPRWEIRDMAVAVTDDHGTVLVDKVQRSGSNNIAELWAVKEALEWCRANGVSEVVIKTDSRNNLSWVKPTKRFGPFINDPVQTQNLHGRIQALRRLVWFQLEWIPREQNLAGHYIERKYSL